MKMTSVVGLTLTLLGAGAQAEDQPAAPAPEQQWLLGEWKFDASKSDDMHAKLQERRAGGREGQGSRGGPGGGGPPEEGGRGGGGGHGGGRMGGGPHGGMGGGGPQQWEARRALMEELLDPAQRMTIVWAAPELTLTTDDGRIRRLRPDGRPMKSDTGLERKVRWESGHLIVENKLGDLKAIETWSLAAEEPRLRVTTRVEGGPGEPLVIQTAYAGVPKP